MEESNKAKKGDNQVEENNEVKKKFDLNEAVEEFIKCAQRTILPFNQVAYEAILSVLELALIREAASRRIMYGTKADSQIIDYRTPPVEELDDKVMGIIDEVNAEIGEAGENE